MKNLVFLVAALLFTISLNGQVKIGIKGGIHSYDFELSELDSSIAKINEATYGIHLGVFTKLQLGGLYVEPSIILNNISAKYSVSDTDQEIDKTALNIDIPVVAGLSISIIDVFAGPVAHLRFTDYDDLIDAGTYDQKVSSAFFGVQFGAGIHFDKLGIDLRYEKNFKDRDLGISEAIDELKLIDSNSRIIASLSYSF